MVQNRSAITTVNLSSNTNNKIGNDLPNDNKTVGNDGSGNQNSNSGKI